ncbi:MAG: hypothetical protein WAL72_05025 [Streptosporangiaceae bacterium]
MKFYVEVELDAGRPMSENRFDALANALYDLDASDPEITDTDLGAALTEGRVTVSMAIDADDPAVAATKALCAVRAALHAIGNATPGWEAARSVMRIAPAEQSERLFTPA